MTRVFSDHCGPKGDKGDQGPPGIAGVSVIGMSITGSIANAILFADASGNLAQDAGLTFDGSAFQFRHDANSPYTLSVVNANDAGGSAKVFVASATDQSTVVHMLATGAYASLEMFSGASGYASFNINPDDSSAVEIWGGSAKAARIDAVTQAWTIPSLAGTGTRTVVVDANGKLSAP